MGGPAMKRHVRATYEWIEQMIRIRHPYLVTLRPLLLAAYVCCTWGFSAVLARTLPNAIHNPLDPSPLFVAWYLFRPALG